MFRACGAALEYSVIRFKVEALLSTRKSLDENLHEKYAL